ncbi:hypothetical protein ABT354_36410 [Streptomyces sp. NPDC000594]|uniref:hypothetical protein n=1 Tax=Streptomyces sp. NPDC000594 TaxID=3154261 RepID=UPI00332F4ADA
MSTPLRAPTVEPWIVPGSRETALPFPLRVRRGRLEYADETSADRTPSGVLLHRGLRSLPEGRRGRPRYQLVHPARQRAAMLDNLCQICGGPASVVPELGGTLFLLIGHDTRAEGAITLRPPLCAGRRCARAAVEECHEIQRRGHTAVRVRSPLVYGYSGRIHAPGPFGRPVYRGEDLTLPPGHARSRWLLAATVAVRLQDCTPVDLAAERRAA